jgi:hypothetical protein
MVPAGRFGRMVDQRRHCKQRRRRVSPRSPLGSERRLAHPCQLARPNNESLGAKFGYMSAQTTETVGQNTSAVFEVGMTYTFASWANPADALGEIIYRSATTTVRARFVLLPVAAHNIEPRRARRHGFRWRADVHDRCGRPRRSARPTGVRLGDGWPAIPAEADVWFDDLSSRWFLSRPASFCSDWPRLDCCDGGNRHPFLSGMSTALQAGCPPREGPPACKAVVFGIANPRRSLCAEDGLTVAG